MPKGQCRCGGVRYRLKPPVAYTGQQHARTLTVPQERFTLQAGAELMEGCGPWQLCSRCGTTLFQREEQAIAALACTIQWPAQNVDDLYTQTRLGNYLHVKRLIHRGMPLEGKSEGWTPLAYAASAAKLPLCRLLIKNGARLEPALGPAAFGREPGTRSVLRLLLRHGADRQTLFGEVASGGRVKDARTLYDPSVDVNFRNQAGDTPLYLAACNSPGMVRYLLKLGADVNLLNTDGDDPLSGCAWEGKIRCLRVLLAASPSQQLLDEALVAACLSGKFACVNVLLEAGANVNQEDYTPLMAASRQGSLFLVNLLLERGADPHAKDAHGRTAIDIAGLYGPDFLSELRNKFRPNQEGRVLHKWTTNEAGEPALKLRKNAVTEQWTNRHAAILERLRNA